jgi:hypothetical protein
MNYPKPDYVYIVNNSGDIYNIVPLAAVFSYVF